MPRKIRSKVGVIPRGMPNHNSHEGHVYKTYCKVIQAQWGPLPKIALNALREAGRAHVELQRLADDLESARKRRRMTDARMLRRQIFALREQLTRLERRIEELCKQGGESLRGPSLREYMKGKGEGDA